MIMWAVGIRPRNLHCWSGSWDGWNTMCTYYLLPSLRCARWAEGVLEIEARMEDVRRRYGAYPQMKWDENLALLRRFEQACGGQSI